MGVVVVSVVVTAIVANVSVVVAVVFVVVVLIDPEYLKDRQVAFSSGWLFSLLLLLSVLL